MSDATTAAPPARRRSRRGIVRRASGREVGALRCYVSAGLFTDLRLYAAEKGRTQGEVVEDALRRFLDAEDEREGVAPAGGGER